MARFRYRMQNILELKKKLEDQQKMALATARISLNEEEDKLEGLYIRKSNYEKALREACRDKLNINSIKMGAAAFESMDYFISRQKIEVKKAEGRVVIEQEKMSEAMKARKIQEKLREKSFDKYLKDVDYEESAIVDELVAYKYGIKENDEEWR